jgi:hypothetical protein
MPASIACPVLPTAGKIRANDYRASSLPSVSTKPDPATPIPAHLVLQNAARIVRRSRSPYGTERQHRYARAPLRRVNARIFILRPAPSDGILPAPALRSATEAAKSASLPKIENGMTRDDSPALSARRDSRPAMPSNWSCSPSGCTCSKVRFDYLLFALQVAGCINGTARYRQQKS